MLLRGPSAGPSPLLGWLCLLLAAAIALACWLLGSAVGRFGL